MLRVDVDLDAGLTDRGLHKKIGMSFEPGRGLLNALGDRRGIASDVDV